MWKIGSPSLIGEKGVRGLGMGILDILLFFIGKGLHLNAVFLLNQHGVSWCSMGQRKYDHTIIETWVRNCFLEVHILFKFGLPGIDFTLCPEDHFRPST